MAPTTNAQFVGIAAYEAAGGVVMRDLFAGDVGGWLRNPALLDRLAEEKLKIEAEVLRAEGRKGIKTAIGFPHGHASRLRRLKGEPVEAAVKEEETCAAL